MKLILVLSALRLLYVYYSSIWDCDETFNYIEPMHYIQYGYGLQTWEYSPEFAIRSWLYVYMHAVTSAFTFTSKKYWIFYGFKSILALISTVCEVYFINSINNKRVRLITWIVFMTSTGMSQATIAMVPSAFVVYCVLIVFGLESRNRNRFNWLLGWMMFGTSIGWIFGLIVYIPMYVKRWIQHGWPFLRMSVVWFIGINGVMCVFEGYFYSRPVFVNMNIALYNVVSNKSVLYGIESMWFYVKNLLLQFNVICVLSLIPIRTNAVIYASIVLFIFVFQLNSHKEERFLYPIYPLICYHGSVVLDKAVSVFNSRKLSNALIVFVLMLFSVISVGRTVALYQNYNVHSLYIATYDIIQNSTLCYSSNWYTFPSHYFIHPSNRIGFVDTSESDNGFNGILPVYFTEEMYGTWFNRTHTFYIEMNDNNQPLQQQHTLIEQCNVMVDVIQTPTSDSYCRPILDKNKASLLQRTFPLTLVFGVNSPVLYYCMRLIK